MMAISKQKQTEVESPAPQLPPTSPVMGTHDLAGFIWQQLSELQSATGAIQESQARLAANIDRLDDKFSAKFDGLKMDAVEVKADIKTMKSSVDSAKSKIDDLVNWKNRIIGGTIAIGVVVAVAWGLANKAGDYITIKAPATVATPGK